MLKLLYVSYDISVVLFYLLPEGLLKKLKSMNPAYWQREGVFQKIIYNINHSD